MFKNLIVAAAVATGINAIGLEADAEEWGLTHEPSAWTAENYHGDNYYTNPGYHAPSYETEYGEVLPGADFNKQVWQFNTDKQIWDQNDYEERVKVEAEMLVALEAMKDAVHDLDRDIDQIDYRNHDQEQRIGANQQDVWDNHQKVHESLDAVYHRVEHLQETCQHTEYELEEAKDALILYCQQYAFASYMVAPCAEILSCRDTQLSIRYNFSGDYHSHYDVHDHHDVHDDHQFGDAHSHSDYIPDDHSHSDYIPDDHMHSSHGYELNMTGGNTHVVPGTHPELAAAAVSPTEAVIQVDGETYIVPTNQIDPNSVELACDDDGCVLIPDDGIASNDIHVPMY